MSSISAQPAAQQRPSPVLVLGMHRSGTSCLAGCLEEAGLFLGEVNTAAPFNKKGNRENVSAMKLHDGVLAAAGGRWDAPPPEEAPWDETALADLAALIEAYPTGRAWGVKDPRMLFVISGWRQLTAPRLVGTFRHPAEVVRSLVHRAEKWKKPMSEDHALSLWLAYNRRLMAEHAAHGFPLIRYGDAAYQDKLAALARSLGLTPPARFAFFENTLRHNQAAPAEIPTAAQDMWEALNHAAL